MTREDGSVIGYTFDNGAGWLVATNVTGGNATRPPLVGTTAQAFAYDGLGHHLASTDNNDLATTSDDADCTWLYDSLGRTIEESQTLGLGGTPAVVSYQYTANDRAALVYPNGRMTGFTAHYPGGPLRAISDLDGQGNAVDGPPIAQYDYLGGRTLLRAMQNGVNLEMRDENGGAFFDVTGHPTRWLHVAATETGTAVKIGFEYAYDGAGNKFYQKSVHDPLDGQRYAYDSADRLLATRRGAFSTTPYSYSAAPTSATWLALDSYEGWNLDGLGTWSAYASQRDGLATATQVRTDDTFNSYATVGGVAETHDLNGNLINDGKRILKWDAMNRLREVWTTTGTLVATYTYDTIGRRIAKTVQPGFPGESSVFRFADWRIVEEQGSGAVPAPMRQYTYGNYLDEVLTMDADLTTNGLCNDIGDRRLFYHQNNLFSVYALTDRLGSVLEGYEYDPYGKSFLVLGNPEADTAVGFGSTDRRCACGSAECVPPSGNSRTFAGQICDFETSFVYSKMRYLRPGDGYFISRDPLGPDHDPLTYCNDHAYVGGSPVSRLDPYGLEMCATLAGDCGKWQETVTAVLSTDPVATQLGRAIKTAKGPTCPSLVVTCVSCDSKLDPNICTPTQAKTLSTSGVNALSSMGSQIFLCADRIKNAQALAETLRHEMTHQYDHCRGAFPWLFQDIESALKPIACAEIRAYSISRECCSSGLSRKPGEGYSDCVKTHAQWSVEIAGHVSAEVAKKIVEEQYAVCGLSSSDLCGESASGAQTSPGTK